jgi:hypothetical protein
VGQPSRSVDNKVVQINELTPETDYVFRIRAVNGAGTSQDEYEISTSVFKGGNQAEINWLKFNPYHTTNRVSSEYSLYLGAH